MILVQVQQFEQVTQFVYLNFFRSSINSCNGSIINIRNSYALLGAKRVIVIAVHVVRNNSRCSIISSINNSSNNGISISSSSSNGSHRSTNASSNTTNN